MYRRQIYTGRFAYVLCVVYLRVVPGSCSNWVDPVASVTVFVVLDLPQVHLANLFGEDKVSFDDRVSFVEDSLDKVSGEREGWRGERKGGEEGV